jgi:hypothetical protein
MHASRIVAIVALLAASTAGIAACDPNTDATSSPATSVAAQTATTTADQGKPVPDFVGMGLQAAQDDAQAKGFYDLDSHDASGRGRQQLWDRNWTVCDQTPAAGSTAPAGVKIDMGAVKTDETCPDAPTTAAPSPTPSPTTTSPRPKPKPTPTHHTSTHHATTGGGGSSGGSSSHTEPPVDDHGGATALCNDGTLSFSAHHQGTCSHHGGVAEFYK